MNEDGNTVAKAAKHAAEFCKRHPAWIRICDLPDGWLDEREKAPPSKIVTSGGEIVSRASQVPRGQNVMMVFLIGRDARRAILDPEPIRLNLWPVRVPGLSALDSRPSTLDPQQESL